MFAHITLKSIREKVTLTVMDSYYFSRHIQQPGYAEPDAADLGESSADAEHALRSLHAQHDAVSGAEPWHCLAGLTSSQQTAASRNSQSCCCCCCVPVAVDGVCCLCSSPLRCALFSPGVDEQPSFCWKPPAAGADETSVAGVSTAGWSCSWVVT